MGGRKQRETDPLSTYCIICLYFWNNKHRVEDAPRTSQKLQALTPHLTKKSDLSSRETCRATAAKTKVSLPPLA